MIKVLLADNQTLTAAGLDSLLNQKEDITIVDHVTSEQLFELPE